VKAFVFADRWFVGADPAAVAAVVHDVAQWSRWWPSVHSVERAPDAPGGRPVWRFTFRTRLPYTMRFAAEVVHDDPSAVVEVRVTGRVEGRGSWLVRPVEGGAEVRFDWVVRPTLLWMRVLSPVARPVFAWNHRSLMGEGGAALARELGRPLLRPVVSELHLRSDD
jgi:carbon monoxide dehydrogenase subunit G